MAASWKNIRVLVDDMPPGAEGLPKWREGLPITQNIWTLVAWVCAGNLGSMGRFKMLQVVPGLYMVHISAKTPPNNTPGKKPLVSDFRIAE